MGWRSVRSAASLWLALAALAIGGCGGTLRSDVLLLPHPAATVADGATLDVVAPIPALPARETGLGTAGPGPAAGVASEGHLPDAAAAPGAEDRGARDVGALEAGYAREIEADSGLPQHLASLGPGRGLDTSVVFAFEPVRDETLVAIMLGLREWPTRVAQASGANADEVVEHDPWEPFNEAMFEFNLKLDRWVLKPVAEVWDVAVPDELKLMIARGFDNFRAASRIVNSLLQAKWGRAGTETGRFLINSTLGFGGLWDIARQEFNIQRPDAEDFGQTLGVWGVGPGPYLVLPVLAPTTVRDIIGRVVDGFMNPASYFTPFVASIGLFLGDTVNERALNLELFHGFELTTLDFYAAVRNAYLARRARQIEE